MTEKTQTKVYLPDELKQLVDADKRSNSEVVEAALWREFGGHKKSALEQRLEEIENRIDIVESERKERVSELTELKEEARGLRNRLDEIENGILTDGEEDRVREILDTGERVFDNHDIVEEIARNHDLDKKTAHDAIKDQVGEDYPPIAFELSSVHEPTNWKDVRDST